MTDFLCIKEKGKPKYDPSVEEERRIAWGKIPDGKIVNMPIIVPNKQKTWAQCKLIFGNMVANAVHQANEKHVTTEQMMIFLLNDAKRNVPNGVPVDKHFLHAFMYLISPTFNDDGEPITLRDMDTEEASRLFKVCQIFFGTMGIKIDDPPKKEL